MKFEDILYEVRNRVAWITINRPDKMNALNAATIGELDCCFAALAGDPAVREIGRASCRERV